MVTHVVTRGSSEYMIHEIFELLRLVFVSWLLCHGLALAMEAAKNHIVVR